MLSAMYGLLATVPTTFALQVTCWCHVTERANVGISFSTTQFRNLKDHDR